MAHMQRPGRIGRDEFDKHLLAIGGLTTEARAGGKHLAHDGLAGCVTQSHIDEAGPGDLKGFDMGLYGAVALERSDQGLRELARIVLQRLGQLHGRGARQVSVGGEFGRFEGGGQRAARAEFVDR